MYSKINMESIMKEQILRLPEDLRDLKRFHVS